MTQEISIAENIIKNELKSLGYFNFEFKNEDESQRSFMVIANGALRSIILQVLVMLSDDVNTITDDKIAIIKKKAIHSEKEPWSAVLKMNTYEGEDYKIFWKKLSH